MPSPSVYLVVLSYNGKALTIDCLHSCLAMGYDNFTILVVDNASFDDSVPEIRSVFASAIDSGKMVLITSGENLGFAGGNNLGMKKALELGADYVMLLNNDTLVDPDLLDALISVNEALPDVGISAPKIYYFEPKDQIWFAGGEIELQKGLSRHIGIRETDHGQFDIPIFCDYVTGCAMLIKRRVIEKYGYLDTAYRMYSEDADYCFRASTGGEAVMYIPEGKVWHKISAGTGGQLTLKKISLRLRSSFVFYGRWAKWYHWFTIPVYMALDAVRVIISVSTGKIKN